MSAGVDSAFPATLTIIATFRTTEPELLPPFLGTALHGALGRALYRTVCAFPRRNECPGCPLYERCSYPALFQTPAAADESLRAAGIRNQAPRPLVLAPEPGWTRPSGHPFRVDAGREVPFRLTLIGRAATDLPIVVVALQNVARRGLGIRGPGDGQTERRRGGLELVRVTTNDGSHTVYDGATDAYTAPPSDPWLAGDAPRNALAIELVTPLRLKKEGRFLSRVEPIDFIETIARRLNALAVLHGSRVSIVEESEAARVAESIETIEHQLRVVHVRRYSSTQRTRMTWPGVMGRLVWKGNGIAPLWPFLRLGELVQIGKATTFGFGRYQLADIG